MEPARHGIIEQKSSCDCGLNRTMTKQQDDKEQHQSSTTTIIRIPYICLSALLYHYYVVKLEPRLFVVSLLNELKNDHYYLFLCV